MRKLILTALIFTFLLTGCGRISLYDYALTLEDDKLFVSKESSEYASAGLYELSEELDDGSIIVTESKQSISARLSNYTELSNAADMQPQDLAYFMGGNQFIRSDGSVWTSLSLVSMNFYTRSYRIYPLSGRSDTLPETAPDLKISIHSPLNLTNSILLNICNNGDKAIEEFYIYLFVQLSDGNWYFIPNYPPTIISGHYAANGKYFAPTSDDIPSLEPNDPREYSITFDRYDNRLLAGHYRIGIYSDAFELRTGTNGESFYTALPFPDDAKLIAAIDFDLVDMDEGNYRLKNFDSSVEDFTVE